MLKKLRNRMLLLCLGMITIVMVSAFAVIYLDTYRNVQNEREEQLNAIEQHFNSPIALILEGAMGRVRFLNPELNLSQTFLILADEAGEMAYLYTYIDISESAYHEAFQSVWAGERTEGVVEIEGRPWRYRVSASDGQFLLRDGMGLAFLNPGIYIISFVDIAESTQMLRGLLLTFIVVGLIALVAFFLLSLYLANRSIKPVEESIHRQKQFVQNASHELKTPLAIIAANTEAILSNGEESVNSQKKWISYIQSEIQSMSKLIGDMLYLAKAEDATAVHTTVDLSHIVENTLAAMEARIFEKDISITQNITPGIQVEGDHEKLSQLTRILLDNAAKYTDVGGEIWVGLYRAKPHIIFAIKNTGSGILPEHLPHIFERFYRGNLGTEGTGLGLSIAKAIIEHMGGTISASSDAGITVFEVKL